MCKHNGCYCIINGRQYDLTFILTRDPILAMSILRSLTGCDLLTAKGIVNSILKDKKIPRSLYFDKAPVYEDGDVSCPICKSQGDNIITKFSESGAPRLTCQLCKHQWRSWK